MEKAKRATIQLGDRELEVFLLPNGSYDMSQAQVAGAVKKGRQNASDFLRSKWLKSLPDKDYTRQKNELIEVESEDQTRGGTRIAPISLELAAIYWYYQAQRGNKDAEALVIACLTDSLLRRADQAFGVVRTLDEYNQRLRTLERDLRILGNEYTADDLARQNERVLSDEVQRLQTKVEEMKNLLDLNGIEFEDSDRLTQEDML